MSIRLTNTGSSEGRRSVTMACLAFLVALLLQACTYNWPQFRGEESNMVAKSKSLPDTWSEDQNVRWTFEVEGESWTSPIVWGDRVYFASSVPVSVGPEPERRNSPPPGGNAGATGQQAEEEEIETFRRDVYRWEVTCVDLNSGEELWNKVAFEGSPRAGKHRATNYASETPVTDGDRLYVYFGNMGVYCYSLDGELLWEKDLGAYETLNDWGTGSSPVVHEDMLYVQVDNEESSFLVALDVATGEQVWRADREEKTNYSTPLIWKNSRGIELVAGGKTVRSYDPVTGEVLWELQVPGHYNIPSAVADRNHIYLGNTAFRDTPGSFFAVREGASGDITPQEGDSTSSGVIWSDTDMPTGNPSPLLYGGFLYLLSSRGGELTCLEASDGRIVYQEKIRKVGACWASPWAYGDQVFFIDENGLTSVIKAGAEFELLHQNSLEDKFWASPAFTRDAMILKGVEKMYCIGL